MKFNLKGQNVGGMNPMNILIGAVIGLLVVGVVIAFALVFLSQANESLSAMDGNTDDAQAAITATTEAISDVPGWLPLIVLAFIMVVVLGLVSVVAFIAWRMQGSGGQ